MGMVWKNLILYENIMNCAQIVGMVSFQYKQNAYIIIDLEILCIP